MSRVEDAQMRLYEKADLRDELTDDEAEKMLKWAERELARLDASGADDPEFEAKAAALMDLLKQLNRYAGRQGQLTAQAAMPDNIAALAANLGYQVSPAQVASAATGDPSSTIEALTQLLHAESPHTGDQMT